MSGMPSAAVGLRVVRAVPFASVCVVASALGHVWAGGGRIPLPTLLLGWAVVLAAAVACAGRERSLPTIAAGLAVGQLGLHLLFHRAHVAMDGMAGMGGGADGAGGAHGSHPLSPLDRLADHLLCGPLPHGMTPAQLVSFAGLNPADYSSAVPHAPASWQGITVPMLLGHLLAAVVAGWWLRRGEAAVWRVLGLVLTPLTAPLTAALRLLRLLLGGLTADADAATRGTLRPARWDAAPWRLPAAALLRHQLVRRGPPVPLPA